MKPFFKRKYVVRQRKNLVPTITGIQLIDTINNDLLKSVELTGMWEKKLRQIENGEYDVKVFLDEMKLMVAQLVHEVTYEQQQTITIEDEETVKTAKEKAKTENKKAKEEAPKACPKCKNGQILKGKTAYGCSAYKEGCTFKVAFEQYGKKLTEKQVFTLIEKGKTAKITGFIVNGQKVKGVLSLKDDFSIDIAVDVATPSKIEESPQILTCPKCKQGTMLKGKSAYGCSRFREGCQFLIPFTVLQNDYQSTELSNEILAKMV